MKNVILVFIGMLFFASCGKKFKQMPRSSFSFKMKSEFIDSNVSTDRAFSINSRGFLSNSGFYVTRASVDGADGIHGGIAFQFDLQMNDAEAVNFPNNLKTGQKINLGIWDDGNSMYYGLNENDIITQYTSMGVEGPENQLTILTDPELVGTTDQDEAIYKINVSFNSILRTPENPWDELTITDGEATLYLVDFE